MSHVRVETLYNIITISETLDTRATICPMPLSPSCHSIFMLENQVTGAAHFIEAWPIAIPKYNSKTTPWEN